MNRGSIKQAIPHREPFLLLDEILSQDGQSLTARFTVREDDPLFENVFPGHYPGNPITPGVLLCEIVFQAGAVLMSQKLQAAGGEVKGSPVVTRIRDAKFKTMVKPGDILDISVEFEDQVSNAYYLKGGISVNGKNALRVAFTCALV